MKLYRNIDFRVLVSDIETLAGCIDLGFYNPDTGKWHEFEISEYRNDLEDFISFYTHTKWDYCTYYNGVDFDAQVIQYIITNHEKWYDLTGFEIAGIVYAYAQKVIDDKKYGLFAGFREKDFSVNVIDVFKILGLDNEARWTSLKKCEFQLDFPSVEEMPIHHSAKFLTREQIEEIKSYRRNDVLATYEVLKLTLGETDHPIYKGNNQLDLRVNIREEFGIPCLNYSDIKIGDELLKKSYAEAIRKDVSELPRKGFFRKEIRLKKCIPSWVEFKTPQLKKLLADTRAKVISPTDTHEVEFKFYGTTYTIGLGGGHSDNTCEIYKETPTVKLVDLDVGSLYPAIIVNNGYYPYHLGKELLNVYTLLYNRRLELKPLAKKDKKIKGIVDALKLVLNSVFGKMGSMDSWLYDKQALVSVTLTGQFCLLMLIEAFELEGIHVFSFNTDGITLKLDDSKAEVFERIYKEWEQKTNFVLERADYKKIVYSTVNDYLAITTDGKPKVKGDFISDFELWKNKSWRVNALALQEYFINGTSPVDFIRNHKNIYDFCIMSRARGELYLEMQKIKQTIVPKQQVSTGKELAERGWISLSSDESYWIQKDVMDEMLEEGKNYYNAVITLEEALRVENDILQKEVVTSVKLNKLVRYYLSSSSDWILFKRGTGSTGKPMNVNQNAPNELGDIKIQYFNQYEEKPMEEYEVDVSQYIYKTLKFIDRIEKTRKAKHFRDSVKNVQQLSLF